MSRDAHPPARRLAGALLTLAALLALAAPARAEVRSGSMQFARPDNPPSLTPQPPETQQRRYTQAVSATYDDQTGAISVHVQVYDAATWANDLPQTEISFRESCSDTESDTDGVIRAAFSYYHAPASQYGDEEYTRAFARLTRDGYQGQADGQLVPAADGFQVTFPANAPLAGEDLRCFAYSGESQYFTGHEPFELTKRSGTGWFKDALAVRYGRAWTHAGERWAICPEEEYFPEGIDGEGDPSVLCMAQFKYKGRYRLVDTIVQQEDIDVALGAPSERTWTRRWRKQGPSCARGARVKGTVWSNDGLCPGLMLNDLDYTVRTHRRPGTVGYHGTNRAGFTSKVVFRCKARKRTITCTNRLGDAFRYTPAR